MIFWRDAVPGDAATLAALGARTFIEAFGHLYAPDDLAAFLTIHTPGRWAAELSDATFAIRIAEEAGELVGYCKLGPGALPVDRPGPTIELRQLYLVRDHQGTGAAAKAMDWVIAQGRARGAMYLDLSVFVENERARRFYRRYGFERIGRYAFTVGTHEDEDDIMRLTL